MSEQNVTEDIDQELEGRFRRLRRSYRDDPNEALRELDEIEQSLESPGNPLHRIEIDLSRSRCYFSLGRYDDVEAAAVRAEERARAVENAYTTAHAVGMRALVARLRSDFAEALDLYRQQIELYEGEDRFIDAGMAKNDIGNLLADMGDYAGALECYHAALAAARTLGPKYSAVPTYLANIGGLHFRLGQLDKAESCFLEAIEIARSIELPSAEIDAVHMMGDLLFAREKLDEAREYYSRALDFFVEQGIEQRVYTLLRQITLVDIVEGKLDEGERRLTEVIDIARRIGDRVDLLNARKLLGDLAEKRGDLDEAISIAREVAEGLLAVDSRENALAVRRQLAERLEAAERYEEASEAWRMYVDEYEVLRNERQEKEIANVEFRYRVRESEQHAERQKEIAAERARQLETATTLLIRRNGLVQSLHEQIEECRDDPDGDLGKRLDAMLDQIATGMRRQDDWERFAESYRLVHSDFLRRLSEQVPSLSPAERKVAALLHIGLSNKQIADLLFVSLRTVESHRYNIRKKIGVGGKRDLSGAIARLVENDS